MNDTTLSNFTEAGQARTTTNPAGEVTTTTLDRHGRPTAVQLPDNSFTYTSYHPNGQVAAKWGRLTNPTFTLYDDQGRVQELRTFANLSAEPTATTTGFAQTTWQYSPTTGLLLSKKDHLLQGASYTYTAAGRLATRTWARSTTAAPQTTEYQYSQGMLTRTDYSDTTPDVTITYDMLGRQDSLQSAVSRTDFVYHSNTLDLDKEIITHTLPGQASFTRTIDRSKDALHRATGYQVLNTNTFELGARYDYSATFGRLAKVSRLSSATTTAEEFGYGYTAQSNLIASVAGPAHTVSNTYEAQRDVLLTKANQRATDNSVISSIGYTVNNIGQRTNATRSGSATNTTAWGYDALGQVTSADDSNNNADRAYLYDTIGNRKKSADSLTLPAGENYSVNDLNQYTNISGFVPTYDKDGNQINAQIQPQASATLIDAVYEWDGENRLRRVKNSAGAILVEYHYDAQSRRIATSANGTTTLYLYDGWNVIAEYQLGNTTFNLHTSYLWGLDLSGSMQGAGGVGGLLAVTEISATSAPATYYPLFDGNGNITEYINSSEAVVAQYQYDPFGNTTVVSGTKANDFAYRFSTKPLDSATGLYYYGYRYYTPQTGRWINRDPIEERGGLNLYGFVGNDGVGRIDMLGFLGTATSCGGTCGADISDWILDEIKAQTDGWHSWKKDNIGGKRPTIEDYLKWANGNQRYKDDKFFEFSKDTSCGTQPKTPGCGRSVTLCGKCVRSAILGNIIYGLVGASDFSPADLLKANDTKRAWGLTVDSYDTAAYNAGWLLVNPLAIGPPTVAGMPVNMTDFCNKFDVIVSNLPGALREGNGNGADYNDLSTCTPCKEKTKESRHGGKEQPRRIP